MMLLRRKLASSVSYSKHYLKQVYIMHSKYVHVMTNATLALWSLKLLLLLLILCIDQPILRIDRPILRIDRSILCTDNFETNGAP